MRNGINVLDALDVLLESAKLIGKPLYVWCNLRYEEDVEYLKRGFRHLRDIIDWEWTNNVKVFEKQSPPLKYANKIYGAGIRLLKLTVPSN